MPDVEFIANLRHKIDVALLPLINADYHLLDVPYHGNVGDSLIWQGELDFLRQTKCKCKSVHSNGTFRGKGVSPNDIILFNGGGNFGDIWCGNHEFKMSVIKAYPDNRIIFFPQSVCFRDENNMFRCAKELDGLSNVILCARDERSYRIFKERFNNNSILVPDMAFYMDLSRWQISMKEDIDVVLLRNDVELKRSSTLESVLSKANVLISDWPSMVNDCAISFVMEVMNERMKFFPFLVDKFAELLYKDAVIASGIKFLSVARHVYSTRLHGAILALLLGKKVSLFDNLYQKNHGFIRTWLPNCNLIELVG